MLESNTEEKKDDDEEELEFVMESVENEEKRRERDAEATPPMLVSGKGEGTNVPEELQDPLSMKREVVIREEVEQSTGEETMEEEVSQ